MDKGILSRNKRKQMLQVKKGVGGIERSEFYGFILYQRRVFTESKASCTHSPGTSSSSTSNNLSLYIN